MAKRSDERVLLGRISGIYGLHGWVKVYSDTSPRENILKYRPWLLLINGNWQTLNVLEQRSSARNVICHIEGYDNRDAARQLIGADIAVYREQLAAAAEGEYYWTDLEGLSVTTLQGIPLGTVDRLFETGANDVMVVTGDRERLIPFIMDNTIINIDLKAGVIQVDWDPEF